MQLRIQKWGNSAAVRLPAAVLEQSGLSIGDVVDVNYVRGVLILALSKPKYSLAALIAQCNPSAPLPTDMIAWNQLQPVGHEAI
jgi:antitoxin ChpS